MPTKHAHSAPVKCGVGSRPRVNDLLSRRVTSDNLLKLGFVDVDYGLELLELAFNEGQVDAFRQALTGWRS
jgi:hypothetical protein